ncbi:MULTISPECIES: efflux RND transporter permease subunit [Mesorhizobium]|uniref:efflux RND transporter permease subunit n=1 Tax=Mesorhizobium TaxID=68287 RepID=UPI0010A97A52|nr:MULTISPECIES: efflux RND transporter permease subunit [Mesorhizobium]
MSVSNIFVQRPIATGLLTLGIVLVGMVAYMLLPISSLPQVDFPTIAVESTLPGANAETMASTVASPLEQQFSTIPGLAQMTSTSTLGKTDMTLQFDLSRNIDSAAQDVQAAINAASGSLPKAMQSPPTYHKVNPALFTVISIVLQSDTIPLPLVMDAASNMVAQTLSQIPGAGFVDMPGSSKSAIRIQLDPMKLASLGMSLEDVRSALVVGTTNGPKGTLEGAQRSVTLDANNQLLTSADASAAIIAYRNGSPIRISDIGRAIDSVENTTLGAWYNNRKAVLIDVHLQSGANAVDVVNGVKAALPGLRLRLPPSVQIMTAGDSTVAVRAAVADVQFTLMITIGLVVLTIFLFLKSMSATIIPAVTIPVSLIGTFGVMYLLGYSLDNISLMGLTIAVGFVVDDAIVVIENIVRHIEGGESPLEATLKGASEIGFTVVSMTASLIAVFIPLLLMSGMVGRLFREFSVTIAVALIISALVSLTLTPMMCALMIKGHRHEAKPNRLSSLLERGFDFIQRGYSRSLRVVVGHPRLVLLSFFATLAVTAQLFLAIPKGFFPQQDLGLISGSTQAAQDISFQAMAAKQQAVVDLILKDPAVDTVRSTLGGSGRMNSGNLQIVLKPLSERSVSADQVIARLRKETAGVSGVSVGMQAVQGINVGARGSQTQFQYTLQDPNLPELYRWADTMTAELRKLPQVRDVANDLQAAAPHASIAVDRDTASRLGITPQAIDDTLYDAFGQRQVTTIFTQADQHKIVMEIDPKYRVDAGALDAIYVGSNSGKQVPLSAFAKVSSSVAPLTINHQGLFPSVTLSFNLAPNVALGDAVTAVEAMQARIRLSATVQTGFQGTAQAFQASLSTQPMLIVAALIAVYIVLGMLYESVIHPITILSTLPSAGVGALAALMLVGGQLDVMGLVGIILLIGIVKKNAIMMIDFALSAERDRGLPPKEAIIQACILRFRPITMTTLCALLGALPLALGTGVGSELRRPLGIAIVGGLCVSQLLTLYTTPVIYLYMQQFAGLMMGVKYRIIGRRPALPAVPAE